MAAARTAPSGACLVPSIHRAARLRHSKRRAREELRHDYLWRIHKHAPPRGEIAVFNRSHYEDVLIVRVNDLVPEDVWSRRYEQINEFERLLGACGTRVVKIFLQISKEEQRVRFQERLTDRRKNWKFDTGDLEKRQQWSAYTRAFEAMFARCSTDYAPLVRSARKSQMVP